MVEEGIDVDKSGKNVVAIDLFNNSYGVNIVGGLECYIRKSKR